MTTNTDPTQAHSAFHEIAQKMGISHPIEALLCAPNRYVDYRVVHQDFKALVASGQTKEPVLYKARVKANSNGYASIKGFGRRGAPPPRGGYVNAGRLELAYPFTRATFRLEIDLVDNQGNEMVQAVFGNIWPWKNIQAGDEVLLHSKLERFAGKWSLGNPTFIAPNQAGKISPVYLGVPGKKVNKDEVQLLIDWVCETDERLALAYDAACNRIREDCGGMDDATILEICTPSNSIIQPTSLIELLTHLHFPSETMQEGEAALEIVRQVCVLSMQCIAQRVNTRPVCYAAPIGADVNLVNIAHDLVQQIEDDKSASRPGFALTDNQKDVIDGICAKLQSTTPMKGLLSGEVGAGKTMAYAIPAVVAHKAGARVGIMAPTDLLANQIAMNIATDFGDGVAVERVQAGGKIRNPDAILVSTIGLNSAAKRSQWTPDFLVYDEQHKLHTAAREELVREHTHTLEVSATPIPRSLGLSLYGGMDLFTLNEQPVEKDIQTGLLDTRDRHIATAALRKALNEGKRVAIVYTLVDRVEDQSALPLEDAPKAATKKEEKEQEERSRKSAINAAELFEKHFPGQVALLHGKMSSDEKVQALDRFRSGDARLMVTTTIFETGIDVPEVQVLVVRDPEHLGLSQLHQLRGRLARSGGLGLCLLLTEDLDRLSEESYRRLSVFCETLDGYELAVQDMLTRGVGDLDGLQQNGKAETVFKAVKMSTKDLLSLEGDRPELNVTAEYDDQFQQDEKKTRHIQQRLFS